MIIKDDNKYYLLSSEYTQYFVILSDAVDINAHLKSKSFNGYEFVLFFNKTGKYIIRFAESRKIQVIVRNINNSEIKYTIHYKDQD